MEKMIEVAKTGRSKCRSCRQAIAKDDLRFGEEVPNQFGDGPSTQWYHLVCAAKKRTNELKEAMAAYSGEIPNRAEVEEAMKTPDPGQKTFPFAEWAPTGRSKCLACSEPIEKDTLRVAVEREVEVGGMARAGAGYLHPECAGEFVGDEELAAKLKANSTKLKPEELDSVLQKL
jgi:hypothetical protein